MRQLALAVLALAAGATSASAQSMRSFATFRQLHGETRLRATLNYRAGGLRITPGRTNELYRMDASYDENRYSPTSTYDAARGVVTLGLQPAGEGGLRVVSTRQLRQDATVAFAPSVDLNLVLTLGAVQADLELGGLRLNALKMEAGASQAVVRFSEPNLSRCRGAEITAGAAELTVLGLGNSRCDHLALEGGMGKVILDFAGAWTSSTTAEVKMAVGELTLRLPRKVGVRLTLDRFLSSFEPAGLVRAGNAYESPGYDRADRKLDIAVTTAVGRSEGGVGRLKRSGEQFAFPAFPLTSATLLSMSPLETLGFALGTSFASGLNLYATVAAVGLFERFGIVNLPEPLAVLAHPVVLGVAITLFLVEFIADKIPYVDSAWDALHTFIRPPAAAILSYSAFADSFPEEWRLAAALLAGGVALTSHGAKASTRAAANASPEPLSNWTLSLLEDGFAVFLAWMAAEHPLLTASIVVVLVILAVFVIWKLFGYLRRAIAKLRQGPERPSPAGP